VTVGKLTIADYPQADATPEEYNECFVDAARRSVPHLCHRQCFGTVLGEDGNLAPDEFGDRHGRPPKGLSVQNLVSIFIPLDDSWESQSNADHSFPGVRVAFAQRGNGLAKVLGNCIEALTLSSATKFPIHASHRKVEELDRDATFPDIGSQQVCTGWVRC
jgi:hypothetical protein